MTQSHELTIFLMSKLNRSFLFWFDLVVGQLVTRVPLKADTNPVNMKDDLL